ncbi:hypothetical protein IMZ48_22275 [Candidatus Bathyarchaeota archaeon]|nr:hypothetical protein [Candidatus Bathyarchaeota archaeon]
MERGHRSSVVEERRRASNIEGKDLNRKDAAQVPPSVLRKEIGSPTPDKGDTKHEHHGHHGLSLGALGHRGHHALHGDHKGVEQTT